MKNGEELEIQSLKADSKYRTERGYLYLVDVRIAGKRYRRFFKHGEKPKAKNYLEELRAKRDNVGNQKAAILEDPATQEMAARAVEKLLAAGAPASLEQAVDDYLDRHRAKLAQSSVTVKSVCDAFLREKESEEVSIRHYQDLDSRTKRFASDFGDDSISSITEKTISEWLITLGLSSQTVLNYRRVLHNLFAFAKKRGHITANPVTDAFSPKVRRKRAVILTPEECSDLLNNCSPSILPAVATMLFCGIRQGEMERLDWKDIDLEDRTITISAQIAKREVHERFVTIPDCLAEWLLPLDQRKGPVKPLDFRNPFEKARQAAGFPLGQWPANALRKTFISCHYESHGSIDETARQAGTSVNIIHKHYRRLIKPKEANKLWTLRPASDSNKILSLKP